MTDSSNHAFYLHQALDCASQRRGFCAPNPAVGAVVVKDQKIIATGTHWAAGHPHAEVAALNKVGDAAKGAILYVTLEPCCHYGKTPPCTELIMQRGISKVIYAYQDPNPQVAGLGAQQLQQAGIECEFFFLQSVHDFYRSYHYWWQHHQPWVCAKIALSQDGKIAGPHGEPVKITGAACDRYTHQCRYQTDAILTTATTVLKDNPQLNARYHQTVTPKPIYVLDSQLRTPLDAKIFQTSQQVTLFYDQVVAAERMQSYFAHNVRCVAVPSNNYGLDLQAVLAVIGDDGMHDLWVEAGGRCFESLVQQKIINSALMYISQQALGNNAQAAFSPTFDPLQSASSAEWSMLGDDKVWHLTWS